MVTTSFTETDTNHNISLVKWLEGTLALDIFWKAKYKLEYFFVAPSVILGSYYAGLLAPVTGGDGGLAGCTAGVPTPH